jgi:hypothetical protein
MKIDFALVNGNVSTFNNRDDTAEAIAVSGGRILSIGTTKSIEELLNKESQIIDVQGKTVLPGFVESHCHPSMAGLRLCFEVDVRNAASIDEVIDLIRKKSETLPQGKWVKGFGYNDQRLEEHRHPTRWDLDKATTAHPVFLGRTDGHLAVTNSLGLNMAKITKDTLDPDGGRFDRDPKSGEPTGVLRETAQGCVKALIPRYTVGQIKEGLVRHFRKHCSANLRCRHP